jgi:hypothetical protein
VVSGLAGQRASPGRGVYGGVLGGIEGMVKSFAAELRPSTGRAPARSTPAQSPALGLKTIQINDLMVSPSGFELETY